MSEGRPSTATEAGKSEHRETVAVASPNGATVQLLFVDRDGLLFVIPTARGARWAADALASGSATVWLRREGPRSYAARLLLPGALAEWVRGAFTEKYGSDVWAQYFSGRTRIVSLDPSLSRHPLNYFGRIRSEFDIAAAEYARSVEENAGEAYLRQRSRERLLSLFRDRDPILELGSGTGAETLTLLEAGHRVWALDISSAMADTLSSAARRRGMGPRLVTLEGAVHDLARLLGSTPDGFFGGAFSTFGALNLDHDLSGLPEVLHRVLAPGSPFFAGVLNRGAALSAMYSLASWRPRDAINRFRGPLRASDGQFPVDVYTWTPAALGRRFAPYFRLERVEAASILLPPSGSPRLRAAVGLRGRRKLERIDRFLSSLAIGGWLSQWSFLTLRRQPEATMPGVVP